MVIPTRRTLDGLCLGFLLLGVCCSVRALDASARPNIVFILADDIGYGDLSCYGARKVQTPNLDRLAKAGRLFTDAHSPASTCTPSRRALLTGVYSWRQQAGSGILPGDAPLCISTNSVTLPSTLKRAGYRNGIVGKWHLGLGPAGGPDWNGEIKPGPLDLGFDYSFIMAATGDRVPTVYIENLCVVGLDPNDPIHVDYRKKIGDEPTGLENPELLKLKHTRGHNNTIVNGVGRIGWMTGGKAACWVDENMADTFTEKAIGFIERNHQQPFFLYFATHNIHVPRVPNPRHRGRSRCGIRGDAIVELDASVGEVLDALDRLKLADDTLVIFTSDNGGVLDDGYEDVGDFEVACNGVLRAYKGCIWEGGHRVPFIARWPKQIPAASRCEEMITLLDMLPTFATLTGQALSEDAAPDGFNVLPALLGEPHDKPLRPTFVAHILDTGPWLSLQRGSWKLVPGANVMRGNPQPDHCATQTELYNLAEDLSETRNVAGQHPELVEELTALLEKIRKEGRSRFN